MICRSMQISEFEAILVYRVSSRTARTIWRKKRGGGAEKLPFVDTVLSLSLFVFRKWTKQWLPMLRRINS